MRNDALRRCTIQPLLCCLWHRYDPRELEAENDELFSKSFEDVLADEKELGQIIIN